MEHYIEGTFERKIYQARLEFGANRYFFNDCYLIKDGKRIKIGRTISIKETKTMLACNPVRGWRYSIWFNDLRSYQDELNTVVFDYPVKIEGGGKIVSRLSNRVTVDYVRNNEPVPPSIKPRIMSYGNWSMLESALEKNNFNIYFIHYLKALVTPIRYRRYRHENIEMCQSELSFEQCELVVSASEYIYENYSGIMSSKFVKEVIGHIKGHKYYSPLKSKQIRYSDILKKYKKKGEIVEAGYRIKHEGAEYEVEWIYYFLALDYGLRCRFSYRKVLKNGKLSVVSKKSSYWGDLHIE